jgi:hypothetical protein
MTLEQRNELQECITYFERISAIICTRCATHGILRKVCRSDRGLPRLHAKKNLVKQRLCCSGMRWTPEGAQIVLILRALALTESRWDQFWQKINQYGVPVLPKH